MIDLSPAGAGSISSRERLIRVLDQCGSRVSRSTLRSVQPYLDIEEDEMALESLVLLAQEEEAVLPDDVKSELLLLGQELHLDTQSVFDRNFWENAVPFLSPSDCPGYLVLRYEHRRL